MKVIPRSRNNTNHNNTPQKYNTTEHSDAAKGNRIRPNNNNISTASNATHYNNEHKPNDNNKQPFKDESNNNQPNHTAADRH